MLRYWFSCAFQEPLKSITNWTFILLCINNCATYVIRRQEVKLDCLKVETKKDKLKSLGFFSSCIILEKIIPDFGKEMSEERKEGRKEGRKEMWSPTLSHHFEVGSAGFTLSPSVSRSVSQTVNQSFSQSVASQQSVSQSQQSVSQSVS